MYLRVTKRRNADGTEVRYYQLAENTWDAERGLRLGMRDGRVIGWNDDRHMLTIAGSRAGKK